MPIRLSERRPEVSPDRLLSECVPPPRFSDVRFGTYRPDPSEPSQAEALAVLRERGAVLAEPRRERSLWSRLRGSRPEPTGKPGLYMDGGFGVGKTHLLASLWHESTGPKMYCTFVELTNLVGRGLALVAAVAGDRDERFGGGAGIQRLEHAPGGGDHEGSLRSRLGVPLPDHGVVGPALGAGLGAPEGGDMDDVAVSAPPWRVVPPGLPHSPLPVYLGSSIRQCATIQSVRFSPENAAKGTGPFTARVMGR